jgi:glutathione synthase/RimK-type ligase-like ATP-grasp enzyme
VILLWGVAEDPPLAAVRETLDARGTPYAFLDQRDRHVPDYRFVFGQSLKGRIGELDLAQVSAAYIRPFDYGALPEHLERVPDLRRFAHHLTNWLEVAPLLVVNRFSAQASNTSKLYQLRLIGEHGFVAPASLATTDPDAVAAFRARYGSVVYKSLSSVRSIVSRLDDAHAGRLPDIRHCPTLFQQYIGGLDYRVHVAGERVFAMVMSSDEDDYRYDRAAERLAVELPEEVGRRCVNLSRALGLALSGIDLRRGVDGRWYCFEVNPSPGFPYYEPDGAPVIANAIVDLLAAPSRVL